MSHIDVTAQEKTISFTDTPEGEEWWLEPLYNDRLMWQIGCRTEEGETLLVTRHGQVGGAIQTKTRVVVANNSGRTIQQQALLEARHRYWKMAHKGYTNGFTICQQYPKPMLANSYDPSKIKQWPVSVQVKIDGVRSLAHVEGEVKLRSRENRPQPYLEQIRRELAVLFPYLPPGVHLDGELYVHEWSFNTLISAVRTSKTKHHLNDQVNYAIFDVIIDLPTAQRMQLLETAFEEANRDGIQFQHLFLVPASIAQSHQEVISFHNAFVEAGYEGAIVRHLQGHGRKVKGKATDLAAYKSNRSNNLLKVKAFQDEEGVVVDVVEGTGTEAGLAILVVEDTRGNRFPVRPRGDFDTRAEWFQHKEQLIGRPYTYRYFELTEYDVPRFPVGIAFRDYEWERF